MVLKEKRILLGVTGGIAAYKALLLARLLIKEGAEVRVALSPAAEKMVGRPSFEAISGHPVLQGAFEMESGAITHIEVARWADLFLLYPLTANTAAKLANGHADDLLSLAALATYSPKLLFPSMNQAMFDHPATQRNLEQLRRDGARVVLPDSGEMACGETGRGRLPEPEEALEWAVDALALSLPSPRRVTIALGRTEEPIDPVRMVTNRSSGKTGLALARAFRLAGWEVELVAGPMETPLPPWAVSVRVQTALQMFEATKERFGRSDLLVMVAAVADFRPASPADQKIKGSRTVQQLELLPNPDILATLSAEKKPHQRVVGFALESEELIANGKEKIRQKGCDLLVLNNPTQPCSGFGAQSVEWGLLTADELVIPPKVGTKWELATAVVAVCNRFWEQESR